MNTLAALASALVAASWQVAVPAVGHAGLRLVVRRPRTRYLGALLTLALQVCWPALTFVEQRDLIGVRLNATMGAQSRWWLLVPLVWALGATVMLARMLGGLATVRRWVRTASQLEAAALARFEALRVRLGVRPVVFGVAAHLDVPLTVGFWRPVVLVPASVLTALPVEALELLVAHELEHVRRWDALVNAAQMVVEALLFFHPAMWWVSRCAREEREYCCDDAVVQHLGAARPYAEALLALEQSRRPATGLAVASTGGAFVNRIRRLIHSRTTRSAWPLVAVLVVLVGGTTALALSVRDVPSVPVIPVSEELRPQLQTLCQSIRAEACRPEVVQLKADPADLMTIVIADLGERSPALEGFLVELSAVPAAQRHDALTQSVSAAIGQAWSCPEFDTLWASRPVDWCTP